MTFEDMIFKEMNGQLVEEDKIFVKGYNQALEDFAKKMNTMCNHMIFENISPIDIHCMLDNAIDATFKQLIK